MNLKDNNRLVMFGRVDRYGIEHPLTPAIAQATDYFTQLKSVITEMETAAQNQVAGFGESRGGTEDCQRVAIELRAIMRLTSKTARTLNPDLFPGLAEELRMPRSQKYEVLLAAARFFVERVTPIKATFVERGMAADFDEALNAQIAAMVAAISRKHAGRQTLREGTLGLSIASKRGAEIVRGLDAIISNKLRTTDPVLLGVWKSASRAFSPPSSQSTATSGSETSAATGTSPVPAA